ncbi:MAG: hypothetical protein C0599_07000 [Salinivirgaceae bacterium]|nr:MAG: hypothetical protein C0599_07000 [Salinivirgaceae bacterium]
MRYWVGFVLLIFTISGFGQQSVNKEKTNPETSHSPKTATLLSTFIPGAGQIYNRKYWKVPLIYGGGATFIYFIGVNNGYYKKYTRLYEQKLDGTIDELYVNISEESLRRERENWRRNRDLNYIGLGVLYFLQIIDANVDAHLFEYDISDDLTFRYQPDYVGGMFDDYSSKSMGGMGVRLTLNF